MKKNKLKSIQHVLDQLCGMEISHAWRGHGSAIFLEIGSLTNEVKIRRNGTAYESIKGEYTIMIEWDWRIESLRSITCGSACTNVKINNSIKRLVGRIVKSIELEGRIKELYISLSDKIWVKTCSLTPTHPYWTIFINKIPRESFDYRNGRYCHGIYYKKSAQQGDAPETGSSE